MKATELRIGNWVNLHKKVEYKEYQISSGFDLYKLDESDCDDISPIPLTEEWVIKLGATKLPTKSGFVASYKLGSLTINKSAIGNYYYRKNVYNNVHQIQNLYYAVEQEELTI